MYLHIPDNGYHAPATLAMPFGLMSALIETYRKRANRRISIKEYRKAI